ncbi:MAG: hypothetical protein GDA48_21345 [Hormoscilla sp. GM102CHS1]|nr:hypothetical protein [Hormoscilla sp. GM102CHS1]
MSVLSFPSRVDGRSPIALVRARNRVSAISSGLYPGLKVQTRFLDPGRSPWVYGPGDAIAKVSCFLKIGEERTPFCPCTPNSQQAGTVLQSVL